MSCPSREQLREFLEERLEEVEREAIEKHAENCIPCQQRLAELSAASFVAPARQPPEYEPDEGFLRRLKQSGSSAHLGASSKPTLLRASPAAPPGVPGYEILHELGRGGMGIVYKARQVSLGRLVALKMILAGAAASEQDRKRFRAEAEAVARLQHPNIVQIHEVGESEGHPFFSLEFVEGLTLAKRLAGKSLPAEDSAILVETLARAVQYAHECGVIHRDLKPANILLAGVRDQASEVRLNRLIPKIADFGLAKQLGSDAGQTHTGAVLGTPDYISPEQAAGAKQVGPAADIYALGAILYECLTGRPPFRNDTPLDTLLQVATQEPVPPSRLRPKLPPDLETICLKCLEKEPRARYATAGDLADDLRRFVEGRPIAARPIGRLSRLWRWARRNPVTAALTGAVAVLLVVVAVGSSVSSLYLRATLSDSERNRVRAENAERDAQDKLWVSYREQARALRFSGRVGQRFESLRALAVATQNARKLHAGEEGILGLRNEAIGCLALTDLRFERTLVANITQQMPHNYWLALDLEFRYFVFSDRQGNLSIRRVADGQETDRLAKPDSPPEWVTVGFSPGGQWLYADFAFGTRSDIAVWEFRDGKLGRKVELKHACVFSPDSQYLAGALSGSGIGVYELATGKEIKRIGEGVSVGSVVFNPAGPELAATLRDNSRRVAVFDRESGKEVAPRYDHDKAVGSMSWSSDGRLLAVACEDQRIYVWDHTRRRLQSVLEGHSGLGLIIKFSHAGDFLISTGWDGTIRLWDPISGRQLVEGEGHFVDIDQSDRQLALIHAGQRTVDLGLWEVAGGWECRTLHHGSVGNRTPRPDHWGPTFLDFGPSGRLLASSHLDGVRLWDLAYFREVGHLSNPETAQVHFHPSGDSLITYGVSGLARWPIRHVRSQEAGVRSQEAGVRSQGSGNRGQLTTHDSPLTTYQIGLPQDFDAPGNWLHPNVVCDRSGRKLLAVDYPHSQALLFDLEQPAKKLVLAQSRVNGCALSQDGRWAFTWSDTASQQFKVHVWSTADGKLVWQAPAGERISHFTPDGRWLVTAPPGEAPLRLWEVGSWKPGGTKPRPGAKRLSAVTSPDGTVLVTMEPGPPRFYHTATGKELATLEAPRNFGGAAGSRFSPDGTWLAVATGNHTIHLWDLRAIRSALTDLGLDWHLPPFRPAALKDKPEPIVAQVSAEVTAFLNERDSLLGQEHVQARKWPEAIESFSRVIERDQTRQDAYHQRGWAHAELEEWPQAAADFAKVVELATPGPGPGPAAGIWYFRALTCLADDDRDGYRRACAGMLEQYGQSAQDADAYWIAWTCTLGKSSIADPGEPVRLAEKLVTDAPDDFDGPAVLGAALYRAGRYAEAEERLQQADAAYAADKSPRQPLEYTWLFLAMAEHRLGHAEAARAWLDRAVATRDKKNSAAVPAGDPIPWNRRVTLQILHGEAEAVLQEQK